MVPFGTKSVMNEFFQERASAAMPFMTSLPDRMLGEQRLTFPLRTVRCLSARSRFQVGRVAQDNFPAGRQIDRPGTA